MSYRIQRINSVIQQELSDLLKSQVKDPRLGNFIAITEVRTSPDLKCAIIFISFIGDQEQKEKAMRALAGASGFLRRELTRRLSLRAVPELSFQWDDSIERGSRIMSLIDQVSAESDKNHPPSRE